MQETKDTSLFTEITAEESASVNGACYRRPVHRRHRGCRNYSSPYFDGRPVHGYIPAGDRRGHYN